MHRFVGLFTLIAVLVTVVACGDDTTPSDTSIVVDSGDLGPGVDEVDRVDIGYLPADVDQSGVVSPFDVLRFRQLVNDVVDPSQGTEEDFIDIDRSGTVTPFDLLIFRQLINGEGNSTRAWSGETLNATRP